MELKDENDLERLRAQQYEKMIEGAQHAFGVRYSDARDKQLRVRAARIRSVCAFALFALVGGVVALAMPDNLLNVGLGLTYFVIGVVVAVYEWRGEC